MNIYLEKFIKEKFKNPGKALDLGAGDFVDVKSLEDIGWKCEGVDIKSGVNLENVYISKNKPFDLVFSNYVIHKIKNKKNFISTIFNNLKQNGWIFIHTFDESDENSTSDMTSLFSKKILEEHGFINISTNVFDFYDDDEGHKHFHKILEIIAQKP
ncbi:MAG: class I SAM-dependent methyltransferase [Candidatus Paceibacterota bacterium]